jgi:hypothetical protein
MARHRHREEAMKKKFWVMPLAAIAVVCTVLLSACGGPSVEELIREDVEKAFSEVSADNEDLMDAMVASSDGAFEQLGLDTKEFAEAYLDGFGHEIKEVVVDEEAGTADAKVIVKIKSLTAIMADFASQFQEYVNGLDLSTVSSEEVLCAQAGQILMDAVKNAEPAETECTFSYEKDDEGSWSATEDTETEILNAMQ